MARWFRLYDTAPFDPKIVGLPDNAFRAWVEMLAAACRESRGGMTGVTDANVERLLRCRNPKKALSVLNEFGLVVKSEGGEYLIPSWSRRQFECELSTPRVRKHRERKALEVEATSSQSSSETVVETFQKPTEQNKTEQIQKTTTDLSLARNHEPVPASPLGADAPRPVLQLTLDGEPEGEIRAVKVRKQRQTWLTPYFEAWTIGHLPGGEAARWLLPLEKKHGTEKVVAHMKNYCAYMSARPGEIQFARIGAFAQTFSRWEKVGDDSSRGRRGLSTEQVEQRQREQRRIAAKIAAKSVTDDTEVVG